ncbi:MAG: nucleotidyltransferase domain-containing protein [Patescibacteria group bacterium]
MEFRFSPEQQQKLCECGVATVYLFGSHAEETTHPLSDVDFAVLMKDARTVSTGVSTHALYQKLYDVLSSIIPKETKDIDIIFLDRAPLELQNNVVHFGRVLFDDNIRRRFAFEERTKLAYADFEPIRRIVDAAVLQRV